MPGRLVLLNQLTHDSGYAYVSALPSELGEGDTSARPVQSPVELFEDGRPLGPAHALHADIRITGHGRFSHWGPSLYFSTSDNSDPILNGRNYQLYVPAETTNGRTARLLALARQASEASEASRAYEVAERLFYEVCPDAFIGEFGKLCWSDASFAADYTRLVPGNRRSFERKFVVAQLVGAAARVPGAMAECGVYNGATAFFMMKSTHAAGVPRRLHLFDSFEGLSLPGVKDGHHWNRGDMAMSEDAARETLAGFTSVTFHKGWIPDRFLEVADEQFAFLHVDVDLYEPTLHALRFFYPRMAGGGVIVCDDYGFASCPGATLAMDEFMRDKTERIIHLPTGQGVILRTVGAP
jgi:hypothetical protein